MGNTYDTKQQGKNAVDRSADTGNATSRNNNPTQARVTDADTASDSANIDTQQFKQGLQNTYDIDESTADTIEDELQTVVEELGLTSEGEQIVHDAYETHIEDNVGIEPEEIGDKTAEAFSRIVADDILDAPRDTIPDEHITDTPGNDSEPEPDPSELYPDDVPDDINIDDITDGDRVEIRTPEEEPNAAGGNIIEIDDDTVTVDTPFGELTQPVESIYKHEPRYGVADMSTSERLENAFDYATDQQGLRDAGIDAGNTKGDEMQVIHYEDGSRDYATPLSAYQRPNNVVGSTQEAINNNLDTPKVMDAFGGNAVEATVVEHEGEKHIVKEGIDGDPVADHPAIPAEATESTIDTLSAAYFVGNTDLHGHNVMISDDNEFVVIDNDAAGTNKTGGIQTEWMDPGEVTVGITTEIASSPDMSMRDVTEAIYDKAVAYETGDVDMPEKIGAEHRDYVIRATEKALTEAAADPQYELPPDLANEYGTGDSTPDLAISDIGDLDQGQQITGEDPIMGERFEGEVDAVIEHDNGTATAYVIDGGREYEVDNIANIEQVH